MLSETEDLMSLSTCSQEVINFYYNVIDVSLEETKQIYALTLKQNNLMWKRHRQVIFCVSRIL